MLNAILFSETVTTPTVMDNILDGMSNVMKLGGNMLTYMAENPVYATLLGIGFVSIGLSVFSMIRGTARG